MPVFNFLILSLLLSFCNTVLGSDWEFTATLTVTDASEVYNLDLAKVDGAYADASMKLLMLSTSATGAAGVTAVESSATTLWSGAATSVSTNAALMAAGTLYDLHFNDDAWVSVFTFQFAATGEYAFFLEHDPDEFHNEDHFDSYLSDSHGDAIEFSYTSEDTEEEETSSNIFGAAIGACVVVWFTTFVMAGLYGMYKYYFDNVVAPLYLQMFASGTLLSASFGLLMFESSYTLSAATNGAIAWDAVLLAGFLTSSIVDGAIHYYQGGLDGKDGELADGESALPLTAEAAIGTSGMELAQVENGDQNGDGKVSAADAVAVTAEKQMTRTFSDVLKDEHSRKTALAILVGDFFHNYCDGIFVVAAFSSCNAAMGWTVALVSVLHELPTELSDMAVLTDKIHLSITNAAIYNMLSGLSVVLGGLTIVGLDVSDETVAYLLAFGAGNFLYLATVECFLKAQKLSVREKLAALLYFIVGACIIIGIITNHSHCEETDDGDAHADH
jgi:zinc transporter ZupT